MLFSSILTCIYEIFEGKAFCLYPYACRLRSQLVKYKFSDQTNKQTHQQTNKQKQKLKYYFILILDIISAIFPQVPSANTI